MELPDEKATDAGGKTFTSYFNEVRKSNEYHIRLIAPATEEKSKNFYDSGVKFYPMLYGKGLCNNIVRAFFRMCAILNLWDRYAGMLNQYYFFCLKERFRYFDKKKYVPDIIILEWTCMVLLTPFVRKKYPNAKIIASEHDVSYLAFERKYKYEKNTIKKIIKKIRYYNLKSRELQALEKCDYVMPHNHKDEKLLISDGIPQSKIKCIVPYYDDFSGVAQTNQRHKTNIVFYGAMSRPENYLSAEWFICNVMQKLKDYDVKFYVIGANPPQRLKAYQAENVIITGFVDSVEPYFETALCMVAPLVLGAGIKVKVLEAMSAALPVLTNEIGIEGIPANRGEAYYHCETADEYISCIQNLYFHHEKAERVGRNASRFVKANFDLSKGHRIYLDILDGK